MADLSIFSYRPGHTVLHRMDARCKLLALIALGLTVFNSSLMSLLILTIFVVVLLGIARLFPSGLVLKLRPLFLFFAFVCLARALFTPGDVFFSISVFTLTEEGLLEGAVICWKMLLVVLASIVYTVTTRPSQTRDALKRLLRPFPFIPKKEIADMIGLMTRFIPVILDRIAETTEAQQARCIDNRKNPVYRIKSLAIPLLQGLFVDAHGLSDAMESRCYTTSRPLKPVPLSISDGVFLAAALVFCLSCFLL